MRDNKSFQANEYRKVPIILWVPVLFTVSSLLQNKIKTYFNFTLTFQTSKHVCKNLQDLYFVCK